MNEKLSFQNITDALAQKAGVQKKVSETFTKAFFDTIVEALYMGEDTIKVKGLGTFKLVEVGSRESVNVSNGERIVISGYKKVSFTPEDAVVEFLNQKNITDEESSNEKPESVEDVVESEPMPLVSPIIDTQKEMEDEIEEGRAPLSAMEVDIVQEETEMAVEPAMEEEVTNAEEPALLDDILQAVAPERVETPQDEFAGIDMLISTPESIEEVRQQLADVNVKVDEAVEMARKVMEEKLRLQKLLERLEANSLPESVEMDSVSENETSAEVDDAISDTQTDVVSTETIEGSLLPSTQELPISKEEERKNLAFERVMQAPNETERQDTSIRKKRTGIAWFIVIALILLAVIIFFLYKTFVSIDAVKDVAPLNEVTKPKVEQLKKKPSTPIVKEKHDNPDVEATKDTSNVSAKIAETLPQPSPASTDTKPSRPSVYIIKKGESLTLISQRFYGTKDSVRAIIRANDFTDPDNVPIGAKVKLP